MIISILSLYLNIDFIIIASSRNILYIWESKKITVYKCIPWKGALAAKSFIFYVAIQYIL